MLLYRTATTPVLEFDGDWYRIDRAWDEMLNDDNLYDFLNTSVGSCPPDSALSEAIANTLSPSGNQEIWAAGVTYLKSKAARMDESKDAGGGDFYDRVYDATRPEIFFKANAARTVGNNDWLRLRKDSQWIVPEPELTLVITSTGKIVGYTIGNDLSCRDIEGENPLYLPQAKTFDRCAAVGPAILVAQQQPSPETEIRMKIMRSGKVVIDEATTLSQMKRGLEELVEFVFRDNAHPNGCFLMTGTGIIPADDFSLVEGDEIAIEIDGIGKLVNSVK